MKKSILITGTTSGIGKALMQKFSKEEYTVFATYRKDTDKGMLDHHTNVHPIKMDVTNKEHINAAFEKIKAIVGEDGLYAIINNAGITYTAPFEYAEEAKARYVMEVNVWAPFNITQKFIPLLKKHNHTNDIKARVVNIASWAGILAQPFNGAYNASKFAIIGLTEAMHYDLGLLDIHAISASPGITKTPLLASTTEDGAKSLKVMPKEGQDFYKPYIDHLTSMSDSSNDSSFFLTPEDIAKKLYKIVETKSPDFKYNLAIDAKIMEGFMRKFLPFGWRNTIFKKMYNLNR